MNKYENSVLVEWLLLGKKSKYIFEEPVSIPLCPLQVPHGLLRAEIIIMIINTVIISSSSSCCCSSNSNSSSSSSRSSSSIKYF
jgi:hypothetical protein